MSRVLICDDAVAYGLLFTRWMRDCGISDVTQARTGAEAETLAERLQPAVIVVDHLMPDATSDELVPRLRAVAPAARFLLISGMADGKLAEIAQAAGADGHIGKASAAGDMRDAVMALMG